MHDYITLLSEKQWHLHLVYVMYDRHCSWTACKAIQKCSTSLHCGMQGQRWTAVSLSRLKVLYLYLHKTPPTAGHCHAFGYSFIATCVIKMHVFLSSLFVCLYVYVSIHCSISCLLYTIVHSQHYEFKMFSTLVMMLRLLKLHRL